MKVKGILIGLVTGAVLTLSAPASAFILNTPAEHVWEPPFGSLFDTRLLRLDASNSIPFNRSLNEGYIELSDQRSDAWTIPDWDFVDGELFKHKARTAARDSSVLPETPLDRELTDDQANEFWAALYRMRNAFERGGRYEAPRAAGLAQVKYDCWIEATEEGRSEDAAACKEAFLAAMDDVEAASTYRLTEVVYVEREMAVAEEVDMPTAFLVYFDFDKSNIRSPDASATIADAVAAAEADPDLAVRIIAHTDTSGAIDYNQALSERRANAVVGALLEAGVTRGRISSEAVGQTQPLIDTGDGVREQGNRVAEIDLL